MSLMARDYRTATPSLDPPRVNRLTKAGCKTGLTSNKVFSKIAPTDRKAPQGCRYREHQLNGPVRSAHRRRNSNGWGKPRGNALSKDGILSR